jgi:NAD(P)-dependent dehydrogenase (short-subunit alcohol dehydrogenase family)
VSSPDAWRAVVAKINSAFEKLDVLVNNAAMLLGKDIEDVSIEEWTQMVAVNMTSVPRHKNVRTGIADFWSSVKIRQLNRQYFVSFRTGCGAFRSSLFNDQRKGYTVYQIHGSHLRKKGDRIRVNAVHPEIIDTQMGHVTVDLVAEKHGVTDKDERIKLSAECHPMGRLGTTTDVAEAVLYLSSDAYSFVTGSSLVVDGGFTAQ